jgi:hypothetical protein
MNNLLLCSLALIAPLSIGFAIEIDFDQPGAFADNFQPRSSGEKGFFESAGQGLSGSRSLTLPYAKQTQIYATTKETVATWSEGASIVVATHFKTTMPGYPRTNRRALSRGITHASAVEPKPSTLADPVHPFESAIYAGIFTQAFNKDTNMIDVVFHGTRSAPDVNFAVTSTPVTLKADTWYYLETHFTESGGMVQVKLALSEMSPDGQLLQKITEQAVGTIDANFTPGQAIRAFIASRDPDFSGVKQVDGFKAF